MVWFQTKLVALIVLLLVVPLGAKRELAAVYTDVHQGTFAVAPLPAPPRVLIVVPDPPPPPRTFAQVLADVLR